MTDEELTEAIYLCDALWRELDGIDADRQAQRRAWALRTLVDAAEMLQSVRSAVKS